jgi:galactose mutarotase-like enzyme
MGTPEHCVSLESAKLRALIEPGNGAKIRSLTSLRTGKEFFYQDSRRSFDGTKGYSYHDIGGMDECFPSVALCAGRTEAGAQYDYPDHGYLWQRAWDVLDVAPRRLALMCAIPELGCTFERTCVFETDETLRLDYRIANHGAQAVPFVYSAHPLLAADERTTVHFPPGAERAYVAGANTGLTTGSWITLPGPQPADVVGPFSLNRHTVVKLFTDKLTTGQAAVSYPDSGERLTFTFDPHKLPHLGYLSCQGNDNLGDGHFVGEYLLAFEPTTGIGDDLETNIRRNTLAILEPGASFSFWIRITIEDIE